MSLTEAKIVAASGQPLASLTRDLEGLVASSEDDFLALGSNLQQVQLLSSAQRQKIADTMSLFRDGDNAGILQQIAAYVQHSQQETQAAQQTATNLCADLDVMMDLMEAIKLKAQALEQTGIYLNVIGINTGIECSRHARMESMFKVVAKETNSLASQIRTATDTLFDRASSARKEEQQTLRVAQQSIASLKNMAGASSRSTDAALEKVSELVDYSVSMVKEAERMSVNITAEINRVVMGIQFHDNLRQRIEHIAAALLETEIPDENSSEEAVCGAFLAVELQRAQLERLTDELEELYATQSQALETIVREVSGLEQRLQSMASEQSYDNPHDDAVAVLLQEIGALEGLNRDSHALGDEILASATQVKRTVADMQTAIRNTFTIANDVKINALNAIIKAAKFGREGEALQVLAQAMVSVSMDTRTLVKVFDEMLEQLNDLARHDIRGAAGEEGTSLAAGIDSARIKQLFSNFQGELQASESDCSELEQRLERELRHLGFISKLKDAIRGYTEQLGRYAASIAPRDQALLEKERNKFGDRLEERYTMNEERHIHHQVLQLVKPVAREVVPTQEDVAGILFEAPMALSDSGAEAEMASSSAAIELFDETPPAQPDAVAPEVELWDEIPPATEAGGESSVSQAASDPSAVELWDESPPAEMVDTGDSELWGTAASGNDSGETGADSAPESAQSVEVLTKSEAEPNENKEDFGSNVELF